MYYRETLQGALHLAIKAKEAEEKKAGFTGPSGFLATLQQMKKEVDEGKQIQLRD